MSGHKFSGFKITEDDALRIAKLSPEFRQILELSTSIPIKDIAMHLQVPEGTAKSRLNRARHALMALRPAASS